MFRSLEGMIGWTVGAADGEIGRITGFIIDDGSWILRYAAIECGSWLARKNALISASSFLRPEATGCFPVKVTREQIRNAPAIDADRGLSRTDEIALSTYYGWPIYWELAGDRSPAGVNMRPSRGTAVRERAVAGERLKSACELEKYEVMASDGRIGRITDLVFDDINWHIYYLIVAAGHLLAGKRVALAASWVSRVDAAAREVAMGLSLQKVKDSPACDVSRPIDRRFEEKLHRHYGMPPYWRR